MKQMWPAALMVQVVQQATQHAGKTKKDQQKKTGTSTLAGQAAPADGEILDQAIVPLPSEQAVTFGSEDAAPGTPVATANADGPEPEASPSTKEIIATMTEGAKDACVSRRLRQQHPGLYNKLFVEEVFIKNIGSNS